MWILLCQTVSHKYIFQCQKYTFSSSPANAPLRTHIVSGAHVYQNTRGEISHEHTHCTYTQRKMNLCKVPTHFSSSHIYIHRLRMYAASSTQANFPATGNAYIDRSIPVLEWMYYVFWDCFLFYILCHYITRRVLFCLYFSSSELNRACRFNSVEHKIATAYSLYTNSQQFACDGIFCNISCFMFCFCC